MCISWFWAQLQASLLTARTLYIFPFFITGNHDVVVPTPRRMFWGAAGLPACACFSPVIQVEALAP